LYCIYILARKSAKQSERSPHKTITPKGEKIAGGVSQKRLFERGQKDVFGLYSALQTLNQKIRLSGGKIEDFSDVASIYRLAKTYFTTKD
jgi:hypothetical protein